MIKDTKQCCKCEKQVNKNLFSQSFRICDPCLNENAPKGKRKKGDIDPRLLSIYNACYSIPINPFPKVDFLTERYGE